MFIRDMKYDLLLVSWEEPILSKDDTKLILRIKEGLTYCFLCLTYCCKSLRSVFKFQPGE